MLSTVVLAAALAGCAPNNAHAHDAVELSKRLYALCLEQLRFAYAGMPGAYRAWLQPPAGPGGPAEFGDPDLRRFIAEAAGRFGVPERWIRAIVLVESDGEAGATSPKGAMGLMQVMPDTYADLRDRFGLGGDPYVARDNILAGSAYMREMYDRYGSPGFIAAYNAGPSRYDEYLASGRELPDETLRYVAAVGAALGENFAGTVFGKLPPGVRVGLRFHEPISVSPNGEMIASSNGQPITVADRLTLHSLLARAVGAAAAR